MKFEAESQEDKGRGVCLKLHQGGLRFCVRELGVFPLGVTELMEVRELGDYM